MNKKELNNISELIIKESIAYYYTYNYAVLSGIESTCKVLEFNKYHMLTNETILKEMKENKEIKYMIYLTILDLIESIEKYFSIKEVIKNKNIKEFLINLDVLNDEIEFLNKDTHKANCNKLKMIYNEL